MEQHQSETHPILREHLFLKSINYDYEKIILCDALRN